MLGKLERGLADRLVLVRSYDRRGTAKPAADHHRQVREPARTRADATFYRGARNEMTVTTADGDVHNVASWAAVDTTSTGLAASVAFPLTSITSVAIRTATGVPVATAGL